MIGDMPCSMSAWSAARRPASWILQALVQRGPQAAEDLCYTGASGGFGRGYFPAVEPVVCNTWRSWVTVL